MEESDAIYSGFCAQCLWVVADQARGAGPVTMCS